MRIIECYIESFGKISAKKYSFAAGLNCFKEDNGSGKTTLAAFIKAMLYGLGDTKKQNLDENDRKHYLPWNGGACGGSLTFESGDKVYRVERRFGAKASDDTMTVYDTATGRATSIFDSGLGEIIFGIDADGFERTVYLSERTLNPGGDNKSISAKLSDLVGCDGDIGSMDDAMKRLEEERKFYCKKGGGGELADTKAKIDELSRRITALGESRIAQDKARAKMTELKSALAEAKTHSTTLMKEREGALISAAEVGYEKQQAQLKAYLDEALERRARVSEVFGERIPSFAEIDDFSYKATEAKNITYTLEQSPERAEFQRLSARFDGVVDRARIERAKVAIGELATIEARKNDPQSQRAKRVFKNRIPRESEIDEIENLATKGKERSPVWALVLYTLFALLTVAGVFIHSALIAAAVVGIVAVLTADSTLKSKKAKARAKQIDDFFLSVSGVSCDDDEEIFDRLREMRASLDILATLGESGDEQREVLFGLVNLFTDGQGGDLILSAKQIIDEYERYAELSVAERYIMGERAVRGERAQRMNEEAAKFLASFKTKTDSPFTELREALTEYNRLTAEIVAKRDELARLESQMSLGEGNHRVAMERVGEIDRLRRENEEKIANLEREYALTERAYLSYGEELEAGEELAMRKSELEETLTKKTDNYETILLTKKYITLAKDSMSTRYLGKTKAGFLKYAEIIGGISGESFEMDTDFALTKQEGGLTKSIAAYSRGTRDLYNLALRLALVDSLYEIERPFIILDDPFTALDDKKTESALKLIKEFARERQIIYFTCAKSRSI